MKERPVYLTTKEVADLLRVKERRVYDLAAAGEIPHRRITGKLLFPTADIMAMLDGSGDVGAVERPAVLTGSHDPLLDWALRESGSGLATLWNGSLDGLSVFSERRASVSGLHVPEGDGWNLKTVSSRGLTECVLVAWAVRARGVLLTQDLVGAVKQFPDLKGRRVARRQPGAGAAALFDALLLEAGMSDRDVIACASLARTESDAAAMVAAGDADAALGIDAMARRFGLGFLPLRAERFDLLIDRRAYFTEPVQRLVDFTRTKGFQAKARAMGGYEVDVTGAIRWLSP